LTWNTVPFYDDDLGISPVAPCPMYTAMVKSADGGRTWQNIRYNFNSLVTSPSLVRYAAWAPDPSHSKLWLGTREHGVFVLTNIAN
jgi:hypothetical protein